ncbi:hypothetical protein TTRE_0000553001 [Trichuris trichiura]|uniref:Uncharacterized protein n=1 Tax=Trichuris trichiura TaxID=36087 RepID=A0A077ZBN0_TRITR|nr:hypothetical protein TTRE_0000553001 [Trichuris trichiura]
MRRATLPSGSACIGSEHVRFQAARALLSDVIVTKDLPNNVRRALKKVGDLINPDHESRSGSDLLNIPSPPGISFPHCGGRISVHEVGINYYLLIACLNQLSRMNNCPAADLFSTGAPSATSWDYRRSAKTVRRRQNRSL